MQNGKASLPDVLRSKLGLNNNEVRILCYLLAWGQLVHKQRRVIDRLRAKLKLHRIKINAINGAKFELREGNHKKLLALGLSNTTKPKPTIAAKQICKRATEAAGAKNLSEGKMEPRKAVARPTAAGRSLGRS
jgi:hypothetical protein